MNKVFKRHLSRINKSTVYTVVNYESIIEFYNNRIPPKNKKPNTNYVFIPLSYKSLGRYIPNHDDFMEPLPLWFGDEVLKFS